jgi:hypothetical protein
MAKIALTIQINDREHPIEAVAERLRAEGVEVTQSLKILGVISCTADESALTRLSNLPGVKSVRREDTFRLPPGEDDKPQ